MPSRKNRVTLDLLPPASCPDGDLTYVVIGARYRGEWIFVRHCERTTWEMPAGHIEKNESPDRAAVRELYEEAGVIRSSLDHICDYAVRGGGATEFGRLYAATVHELEPVPEYEIGERFLSVALPHRLTYPEVQPPLFRRVKAHFGE